MNPRRLAPELTIIRYKPDWLVRRPWTGAGLNVTLLAETNGYTCKPRLLPWRRWQRPKAGRAISESANEKKVGTDEVTSACLALQ